ncbi:MAG: WG repeat-containing protein [Bacteroidota bacterium]
MHRVSLLLTFFSIFFSWQCGRSQQADLRKDVRLIIEENGKFGFIEGMGNVVIPPRYDAVNAFKEGLAAVAINGLFGYIDKEGNWVIKPVYQNAQSFNKGVAKVWRNGAWALINREGKLTAYSGFERYYFLGENRLAIKTKSRKMGMMTSNKILLDTIFDRIEKFRFGHSIVTKGNTVAIEKIKHYQPIVGVVDTLGQFLIELGKYDYLTHWGPHHFLFANFDGKEKKEQGIIDKAGNLIHKISHLDEIGRWENGIAISYFNDEQSRHQFAGIIGADGEWVLKDPKIQLIKYHGKNRLVAHTLKGKYLMDFAGNRLHEQDFRFIGELFFDKYAFITSNENSKKYVIDLNGNFLIKEPVKHYYHSIDLNPHAIFIIKDSSTYKINHDGKVELFDQLSPYKLTINTSGNCWIRPKFSNNNREKIGWFNQDDETIVPPRFEQLNYQYTGTDYKFMKEHGKWGYYDKWGNLIWQSKEKNETVNLQRFRAAHSSYSPKKPRPLKWWQQYFSSSFHIRTSFSKNIFNKKYEGLKIYISNYTDDTMDFQQSPGNRLHLIMQAKDENGEWRDIETMRGMAYCGTGFQPIASLPSGHYWSFNIPIYDGVFKTEMRMALHQNPFEKNEEKIIWYSNEFSGGVNPGQFEKMD